ncbi:MFS transporter [Paenibacillus sp. JX-17]|uniref:MFS transporter n=1 Tax=Paenibacillus lacisoli TaxID=3064525 RepID=A0ABT9CG60_9BACL|nr:MFS transporter [Paenibacillus sp. JX-17]MDO7908191.1 MFS transporter [Paenibacillus sp. JX-17]
MAGSVIKGQAITPFRRLTFGIILGYGLMMLALMTPATLLLTFKMIEIDPNGYTSSYGLVAGIGAFFALLGNPIGGAISDRTNISFGRRRTWILIGPLVGCAALLVVGFASQTWQIILGWAVAQLFFNFGMASYTALIPDQVDSKRQGTLSGIMGLGIPASIAIGMLLMNVMGDASTGVKWSVMAALGIVGPLISLFLIRDGKVDVVKKPQTKASLSERISKVYPSPRKYPHFTWAVALKFLMMMGYCSSLYLTVMLVNRMGLSESAATASVATINIIAMIGTAITSVLGGIWSDKVGKQKPFLYVTVIVIAAGIFLYAFVPTMMSYTLASLLIGIGYGCFSAVDMALVSRILPNKEDAAKDFGIMNVANALPQSIVPAIAPLLLGVGGWSFFYIALAVCTVLSVIALKPIPEVGQNPQVDGPKSTEASPIVGGSQHQAL